MALLYYPRPGEILLCDYRTGFVPPEMVKRRPAVVVSPRLRRRGAIVTVVPLSTTPPSEVLDYICEIRLARPLPPPFDASVMWAKCDMVAAVALTRLDRFRAGRASGGHRRTYIAGQVDDIQLAAIRRAIRAGLGITT